MVDLLWVIERVQSERNGSAHNDYTSIEERL